MSPTCAFPAVSFSLDTARLRSPVTLKWGQGHLLQPWKRRQGHRNLITSFPSSSDISVIVCSNLSIHSGDKVRTSIFQHSLTTCGLKSRVKVTKIYQGFCAFPNDISVQIWFKSIHPFRRYGADKPFFYYLWPHVTLKMGSRLPKSNQFFAISQWHTCERFVQIRPPS